MKMGNAVRTQKREIVSRDEIDLFIKESAVLRLGLISRGEPYIVPLNFVYENETVFFHCAKEGRKIEAIRENPSVCMEFDTMHGIADESADTFYTSAIAWGSAIEVKNPQIAKQALELICRKYLKNPRNITDEMLVKTNIISVRIETVTAKENRS